MIHTRSILTSAAMFTAMALSACGDSAGDRQQASGEIKEGVGAAIGDESLEREGQADQVVGGVRDAASEVGDAVEDATN